MKCGKPAPDKINSPFGHRVELLLEERSIDGKRTRTRTWDPLIKSHQITLDQTHFDISSVRSGIELERKLENVETRTE